MKKPLKSALILLLTATAALVTYAGFQFYDRYQISKIPGDELLRLAQIQVSEKRLSRAVRYLNQALQDAQESVRQAAAKQLGSIDNSRTLQPLFRALKDSRPLIRKEAVLALKDKSHPARNKLLMELLEKDTDREVKRAAAEVLVASRRSSARELIYYFKGSDVFMDQYADWAFVDGSEPRTATPLIACLADKNREMRRNAAMILNLEHANNPQAAEAMIGALSDEDAQVRRSALSFFEKRTVVDGRVATPLEKFLNDPDMGIRDSAAEVMKKIPDGSAVETALKALRDGNLAARREAAKILAERKDHRATEPLLKMLASDQERRLYNVERELAQIGDPAAVEPLLGFLESDASDLRASAVTILGELKDPRAVGPLLVVLENDQDNNIREKAIYALGSIGDSRANGVLRRSAESGDCGIRSKSVNALAKLKDPRAVPMLIRLLKGPCKSYDAQSSLLQITDSAAVDSLIHALDDEDPFTRRTAAQALTNIRSSQIVAPLIEVLKDKDPQVRQFAAVGLGTAGGTSAVVPLTEALGDLHPEVQYAAREALKRLTGKDMPIPSVPEKEVVSVSSVLSEEVPKQLRDDMDTWGINRLQEAAFSAVRTEERCYAIERLHTLTRNQPEYWGAVISILGRILESEQDDKVRYRAVEVLSQIPDTRIEAPMLRAFGDSSAAISTIAFQVLGKMNGVAPMMPLMDVMKDGLLPVMPKTLRDMDDPQMAEEIVSVIKNQKKIMAPHERMALFKALGCLKVNGLKALINLLKDGDDRNKRRAILVLSSSVGAEKKSGVAEGILDFFKDGYGKLLTAEESILALAATRDSRSANALLEVVKMNGGVLPEETPLVSRLVDAKEWLLTLSKALQNEDASLRVSAAEILRISHEYGAVAPLIGALHDKDENVKASAARALGELANQRAVEPLLALAQNGQEKEAVRIQALRALPKVNQDRALPIFRKIRNNPAESAALRLAAKYAEDIQTESGMAKTFQIHS